jgi:zinc transport system permease protein
MTDLLQYAFFQNALIGSFLTAIACGIVGTYIVSRRLVFITGGITHTSFGGLGIGFFAGINPILSALIFSILSAFGVEWVSRKQGVREDSAIAGFWSLGMALGVIAIFMTPGFAPNLSAYLFGNILTISYTDILWISILSVVLIVFFVLFHREILYVAFDNDFAVNPTFAGKTGGIYHDVLYCHYDCTVYPFGWNYAAYVYGNSTTDNRQSLHIQF